MGETCIQSVCYRLEEEEANYYGLLLQCKIKDIILLRLKDCESVPISTYFNL